MVDIEQLRSLNEVFTRVMRQIFLRPIGTCSDQNDVTFAQRKIMVMIDNAGPQKMSDIARQIQVTMSGATAVVDKMVQAGLVTREFSPSDRRVVLIALSEKGREVLRECVKAQEKLFESILDRLAPEKQTELLRSFEQIHTLLQEVVTADEAASEMNPEAASAGQ